MTRSIHRYATWILLLLLTFTTPHLGAQGLDPKRSGALKARDTVESASSSTTVAEIEDQLEELETKWAQTVATNDPDQIGKFFTDDFLFVGAGGVLQNRTQHLDDFRSGLLKVQSVEVLDIDIHTYDSFAVTNILVHVEGKIGERDLKGEYRFMDTWRKQKDRWLAVARQQTRVAVPPPAPPAGRAAAPAKLDSRAKSPLQIRRLQKNLLIEMESARFEQVKLLSAIDRDVEELLPASQRLSLARAATGELPNPPVATPGPDGKILLEARYEDNTLGVTSPVTLHLRSYNGKLVGPTLRGKAGETIRIRLVNNLPAEPFPVPHGDGHHGWNTTNLHTHGLHVKPQADPTSPLPAPVESDNVLIEVAPTQTQEYAFEIPANHPAGTFWYHAHKHGSTSAQVSSGMAGALIISRDGMSEQHLGNLESEPEIHDAMAVVSGREREKILVLQQMPFVMRQGKGVIELDDADDIFAPGGATSWHQSGHSTTVNGKLLPVITFTPGEVQRWRMIHSGFREVLKLQLEKDPDPAIGGTGPDHILLHQIAVDGLALSKRDPLQEITLDPGNRSDVLVKAPPQKGVYYLIDATSPPGNSLFGESEPLKFIAKVVITDAPALPMTLPSNEQIAAHRLESLIPPSSTDPVERAFYGITGAGFVIGNTDPGPTNPVVGAPFSTASTRSLTLGKTQRWLIGTRNAPGIRVAHPFHIHVNPFEVVAIRTPSGTNILSEPVWRDTISMPQGHTIEILTRYDDFEGSFVQHCHILDHEDRGMMQKITISPAGTPTPPPLTNLSNANGQNLIAKSIPKPNGEPSALFFVQGSFCPHCMTQLNQMAKELVDRKLQVVVVSASSESDLQNFPKVPFKLVADPELKLFKEYDAFDGKARHATIVRDGAGKELLRKVGDEPFMNASELLAAVDGITSGAESGTGSSLAGGSGGGGADEIRVREDVDTLFKPENKLKLDALKLAFKTLQDSTDATKNLVFWANIHDAPIGEVTTGPCEHINEIIWPWHRAYLYEFETALRESHPPETSNVTLPYWNWAAPPTGQRLPKVYEEVGSPLHYQFRNTAPFGFPPVSATIENDLLDIPQWNVFGGGPKSSPHKGTMESAAHDVVHGFIGGHNNSTRRAARDPIFFAHHANLDRIWLEWHAKYGIDPVGADETIRGLPGTTVKDWNDVSTKYKYGPKVTPTPPVPPPALGLFASRLTLRNKERVVAYPTEVPKAEARDRLVLRLKNVRPPSGEFGFFSGQVYLHPATDTDAGAVDPKYLLTEFGFWDSTHTHTADKSAHGAGIDMVLDVTARAKAIRAQTDAKPLTLTTRFIGNVQEKQAEALQQGVATGVRVETVELVVQPARKP